MNQHKTFYYFVVVLSMTATTCYGEKILFLLPLATKSHVHVFEPLIRALGERGHDIVNLSPIESPNMPPNVNQIQLITVDDLLGKMPDPFYQRKQGRMSAMFNRSSAADQFQKACLKSLENPKLHELLKTASFDLVIVDIFINYCVLGVVPHFKASSILLTTMAAPSMISGAVGNRLPPSFVPTNILGSTDSMSFLERFANTILNTFTYFYWRTLFFGPAEQMYKEHIPNGSELPGIDEIMGNTSMIFMNSHFTINYPRPLLPDVIEVGGMHTRPAKKLPKDLDEFLTGSGKDGFIFFSMGSIIKTKEMPESYRKVFINVFSKLKQRVLWKWEEEMSDLPPNVKLSKWLPQQDILGHKNIRLFMTHGGLLSTQESVYHGVPVLGLPVFADQDLNIQQAETGGYAKFVEIIDITEEKLESTILELLNNPTYAQKAKDISMRVRDQPQTPLEKAVYWTEYVLRHNGAKHLRSAARDLYFFQYYVLDVTAALIALILGILFLVKLCCKAAYRRLCSRRKQQKRHLKKE